MSTLPDLLNNRDEELANNVREFRKVCKQFAAILEQFGMSDDEIEKHVDVFEDTFIENHPRYSLQKTKEQLEEDEIEEIAKSMLGDEYGKPKQPKKKKGIFGEMLDDFNIFKR